MIDYSSLSDIAAEADSLGLSFSELILKEQAEETGLTEDEIMSKMSDTLDVMISSAKEGLKPGKRSVSGLSGGDGVLLKSYETTKKPLGGSFCTRAIMYAVAIAENNASMGKIVAAPTAGSCGILPAGVLTMMDLFGSTRTEACLALVSAGAIGMVISNIATISGAMGGCQAECGSASAMTAAALTEMAGGTSNMMLNACAISLKNQLGLVCDPVAGLVEVPCIKRNAGGVMNAICAADMALAGIESVIPADEVITAMKEVGDCMPSTLRETGLGGLAATETAMKIAGKLT